MEEMGLLGAVLLEKNFKAEVPYCVSKIIDSVFVF